MQVASGMKRFVDEGQITQINKPDSGERLQQFLFGRAQVVIWVTEKSVRVEALRDGGSTVRILFGAHVARRGCREARAVRRLARRAGAYPEWTALEVRQAGRPAGFPAT